MGRLLSQQKWETAVRNASSPRSNQAFRTDQQQPCPTDRSVTQSVSRSRPESTPPRQASRRTRTGATCTDATNSPRPTRKKVVKAVRRLARGPCRFRRGPGKKAAKVVNPVMGPHHLRRLHRLSPPPPRASSAAAPCPCQNSAPGNAPADLLVSTLLSGRVLNAYKRPGTDGEEAISIADIYRKFQSV